MEIKNLIIVIENNNLNNMFKNYYFVLIDSSLNIFIYKSNYSNYM